MYPAGDSTRSYERSFGSYLYGQQREKSFVDKVFARQDADEIKKLMETESLSREEVLKLTHLLAGVERKIENFTPWDRYVLGKLLTWIMDFVGCIEILLDFQEKVKAKKVVVSERGTATLEETRKKMTETVKYLANIFLYLSRSTLSISAKGFETVTSQRFEYAYTNPPNSMGPENRNSGASFGLRR